MLFPSSLFVFRSTESIGPLRGLHVRFVRDFTEGMLTFADSIPSIHYLHSHAFGSLDLYRAEYVRCGFVGEKSSSDTRGGRLIRPTVGIMRREKVREKVESRFPLKKVGISEAFYVSHIFKLDYILLLSG